MSAPRSGIDAALAARNRRRSRTARHLGLLAVLFGALAAVGIVAGGAALGRWELPYVDDPAAASAPTTTAPYAGPSTPQCGPDGTVAFAEPGSMTIRVLNGTGTEGLAQAAADELAARGFVIGDVGQARFASNTTSVKYGPGLDAEALTVAAHVGTVVMAVDTGSTGISVTLGADFGGVVAGDVVATNLATAALPGCPGVPRLSNPPASPTEAVATT